ncbi:putative Beta-glucosidase btgE [Seiridium cardinale]|uniref:Probable beta-glucosidase btgE n=1 Tax=Seiridium cardinale TaxID=138064 RepID=A0ABR2XC40_9PEZI
MKATFAVAAAAALVGGVSASSIKHRHVHDAFKGNLEKKGYATDNSTCGCTTVYSTWYGEATLHNPPPSSTPASSMPASSAPVSSAPASSTAASSTKPATTAAPTTSTSVVVVVPTPVAQTCPTTGVYTFPATTVTLTETTTVCAASTTAVPSGTHTLGGVTTVVTTATTVTCPYATVSTSEGVTTSVIETTTYVCPSAGTYTIAPTTTTVTKDTTVVVPVVSTYCPGTYTQPEVVTTITETNTVVYCPFEIPATTTAVPVYPTTTAVATSSVATSAVPTSAVATYPAGTSSASTSKPTGSLTGNGSAPWGLTYTPYDESGNCKTKDAVVQDIAAIAAAGVTAVRVYSTDCDTLPNVGDACEEHGIRMILGIFIDAAHCTSSNPTVSEQISSIKSWAKWDIVDLIVVANEAIFNGYCSATELADLINECKSEFSGYTGYYTTTDTVSVWQQSSTTEALCDVVDIVGAQAHAYFNTETVASNAGSFVRGQLDIVNAVCPGKEARVLETGWPSAGTCNGLACAGEAEQAAAIASLLAEVSEVSVFFSLTDDLWKDNNTDCHCEQHWGCSGPLGLSGLSGLGL